MKIGVCDPNRFKFSRILIDHWENQGHEVVKHIANLDKHNECDAVFYEQASAPVIHYSEKMPRQKHVVVRAIDIENYMNYYKRFDWDKIDYFVVLNKAQKKLFTDRHDFDCPPEKIKVIQCGVEMDKFTLKQKPQGKRAVFVGGKYPMKNPDGAIDLVYELNKLDPGWKLHLRGKDCNDRAYRKYLEHRADELGIEIIHDKQQEDMNEYYEDKDLMIVPSHKEAFSYVAAEAIVKGIPAVINNWYGAYDVWGEEMVYNTPSEGARKALELLKMDRKDIRQGIIDNGYTAERMIKEIDKLMGIETDGDIMNDRLKKLGYLNEED